MRIDFEHIKSQVLMHALEIVNDPRIMKVISHPRVMQALSKGIEIKEKIDATVRIWKDGINSKDDEN